MAGPDADARALLGLPPDAPASPRAVRAAFWRAAATSHPNLAPTPPADGGARFAAQEAAAQELLGRAWGGGGGRGGGDGGLACSLSRSRAAPVALVGAVCVGLAVFVTAVNARGEARSREVAAAARRRAAAPPEAAAAMQVAVRDAIVAARAAGKKK